MNKIFQFPVSISDTNSKLLLKMFTNPIVAEVYQNGGGHISGLAGILHNIHNQPASYFYINLDVSVNMDLISREIKNNSSNSSSCISINVNDRTYTIICEINTELMDCNVNDDVVVTEGFNHMCGDKSHFDPTSVGLPIQVWILINGMLLTPV